ncbi:Amino AcidPolyamineOrganocation protein [Perkinsela sp. CCAP 1560/4]|nr:Amino AcidPolyamineOrganocation protein [Perkinsela sp. CCAP 1560/4]|eukprot:KNH07381.1 Amino AcidPolyamineOrganocation protein [Perkinsela sp. CCAP 1560/4]
MQHDDQNPAGDTCKIDLHSHSVQASVCTPLVELFSKKEENSAESGKKVKSVRKINMWRLVALAFVFTCSGPFGVEAVFRAAGPALGLIGLLVTPVLFVVPQIVMVAELATMIPSNHGYVAWVSRALGDYFGFVNAFSTLSANLVNMSVYCALLSSYVCACTAFPVSRSSSFAVKYAIRITGNFIATCVALLPSSRVAEISTAIGSIVMAPFVIGFLVSIPSIHPSEQWFSWEPIHHSVGSAQDMTISYADAMGPVHARLPTFIEDAYSKTRRGRPSRNLQSETPVEAIRLPHTDKQAPPIDWPLWGSTLCWLYTGWNSLGNLAAEVNSASVYTYGMLIAMGLDVVAYLISVIAALSVPVARLSTECAQQSLWEDGYLVSAFDAILPRLGSVVAVVSALSIFGIIINSITCYTRAAAGMADFGWFPKSLAKTYRCVPYNAIGVFFLITSCLSCFDFDVLIQFNFVLAAQGYLLTFVSFLRLKYIEKDTPRPYVVPFGLPGAWITTLVKMVLMFFVMATIFVQRPHVLIFYIGFNVFLSLVYSFIA